MKSIYGLLALGVITSIPTYFHAQQELELCKQHVVQQELPQTAERIARMKAFDKQQAIVQEQMKNQPPTRQVYKIPVVFHVIHYGGKENISDEQIYDAMEVLNRDFRLQNADANNVRYEFNASNPSAVATPADIEIEFVLATKAPNGACFRGITRTVSPTTFSTENGFVQLDAVINGNDVYRGNWSNQNYMSIIVAENLGTAAGYTFLPGSFNGTNMYGSIWINPTYVGRIGTGSEVRSRTLTHEVGHWLNLMHVWGGTNNPGLTSNCDTDDDVVDTPNTIGVTSCNLGESSCGVLANVENYMDYSYCSKMFTHGQRDRMRAALQVAPRNIIWTPQNLAFTGIDGSEGLCSANFGLEKEFYCVNESVQFLDWSVQNQNTWQWEFEGGTPATSTDQNPVVTYATPGKYKVKLTTSDGVTTLTEEKENFVTINSVVPLPYFQGFEGYDHANEISDVVIRNLTPNAGGFDIAKNAAATGHQSLAFMGYYSNEVQRNQFISPNIDLSNLSNPDKVTLSFKYAYRKRSADNNKEELSIEATKDCGETWAVRRTILSSQLSSEIDSYSYVPTPDEFKTVHVTGITSQYFVSPFQFKLSFTSSGGNNFYLDDINLYEGSASDVNVVGLEVLSTVNLDWKIQPNPASDMSIITFQLVQAQNLPLKVIDLNGKTLFETEIQAATGQNEILLDVSTYSTGIYQVQLGNQTKKLVVE